MPERRPQPEAGMRARTETDCQRCGEVAHLRVVAVKGKASQHRCVDCEAAAAEWSYTYSDPEPLIGREGCVYSTNPDHYAPRCKSCHRRHDAAKRAAQEVMSYV